MPREAKRSTRRSAEIPQAPQVGSLEVHARPVESYVRPDATNGALQLANTLKNISPEVENYVRRKQADFEAGQARRAERVFAEISKDDVDASRKQLNKLMHEGKILASENPWFQKFFRETQLRAIGAEHRQALAAQYQESDVRASDDPQAFTQFVAGHRDALYDNLKDTNFLPAEVENVLEPILAGAEQSLHAQHVQLRNQEIIAEAETNLGQTMGATLSAFNGYNHQQVADGLQTISDNAFEHGITGSRLNKLTVDYITQHAIATMDTEVLETLDYLRAGSGPLGGTAYAKKQREAAEHQIMQRMVWADNVAHTQAERAREAGARMDLTAFADHVRETGNADPYGYMLNNPGLSTDSQELILKYAQSYEKTVEWAAEDPVKIEQLYADIDNGMTVSEFQERLASMAAAHELEPGSMNSLHRYYDQVQSRGGGSTKDPDLKALLAGAKSTLTGSQFDFDRAGANSAAEVVIQLRHYWAGYFDDPANEGKTQVDRINDAIKYRDTLIQLHAPRLEGGLDYYKPSPGLYTPEQTAPVEAGALAEPAELENPYSKF